MMILPYVIPLLLRKDIRKHGNCPYKSYSLPGKEFGLFMLHHPIKTYNGAPHWRFSRELFCQEFFIGDGDLAKSVMLFFEYVVF
jgi:hypothetical protein